MHHAYTRWYIRERSILRIYYYSPFWALAAVKTYFHLSLYCALLLQPLIPRVLRSFSTPSNHLISLCLPARLLPSGLSKVNSVKEAFLALSKAASNMGLTINEEKTKFLVSSCPWSHGLRKKKLQLVWRCHQLLSGFLAKGHLPRVSRQSGRSLMIRVIMKWSWGLCTDLLAFALQPKKTPENLS